MEVLKNCFACVANWPVAMLVTALKSESTVLALKLKKSVRNAWAAWFTAGFWLDEPPPWVAKRTPKTSVHSTPRVAMNVTSRKLWRLGPEGYPPGRREAGRRGGASAESSLPASSVWPGAAVSLAVAGAVARAGAVVVVPAVSSAGA